MEAQLTNQIPLSEQLKRAQKIVSDLKKEILETAKRLECEVCNNNIRYFKQEKQGEPSKWYRIEKFTCEENNEHYSDPVVYIKGSCVECDMQTKWNQFYYLVGERIYFPYTKCVECSKDEYENALVKARDELNKAVRQSGKEN